MFIARDVSKSELDDFYTNVSPKMGLCNGATPVFQNGEIVGWNITPAHKAIPKEAMKSNTLELFLRGERDDS